MHPGPPRPNGPALCSHICGHMGMGPGTFLERNPCVRVSAPVSDFYHCSQAGSGSWGRGGGQVLACTSPPHAPPRGPDSGVRGRMGDARPVYPPRAASAPTGGAARAREGEGSPPRSGSGFATCPGAPHPETQDLQVLLPQIQAFRLQPSSLRPRSPNLSSSPSDPGDQNLTLILQIQGPEAQPALPQTQNPGSIHSSSSRP